MISSCGLSLRSEIVACRAIDDAVRAASGAKRKEPSWLTCLERLSAVGTMMPVAATSVAARTGSIAGGSTNVI